MRGFKYAHDGHIHDITIKDRINRILTRSSIVYCSVALVSTSIIVQHLNKILKKKRRPPHSSNARFGSYYSPMHNTSTCGEIHTGASCAMPCYDCYTMMVCCHRGNRSSPLKCLTLLYLLRAITTNESKLECIWIAHCDLSLTDLCIFTFSDCFLAWNFWINGWIHVVSGFIGVIKGWIEG